jgi:hypothetical protein
LSLFRLAGPIFDTVPKARTRQSLSTPERKRAGRGTDTGWHRRKFPAGRRQHSNSRSLRPAMGADRIQPKKF